MLTRRTPTLVALLCVCAATGSAEPPVPDFKIESIELLTFDKDRGEIQPLPENDLNLFRDLIVKVKVTGPNGAYAKGRQLSIELADAKQPAQKRELAGIGMEGATYSLAYFATGIICSPMTVRVRLLGQKSPAVREVKLTTFDCGE